MTGSLEELIASVGASVQAARHAVDLQAAQLFHDTFTQPGGNGDGPRTPVSWELSLPTAADPDAPARHIRVPVAALLSHRPLQLDTVDISIPVSLCRQDGELAFQISEEGDQGRTGTLSLHFVQGDTPEGMARVVQSTSQIL